MICNKEFELMKIIADENLALTDYFFADFATIEHRAGRNLSHKDVIDCDALLVRSVTAVNAELVENTALQFVGSATIGTDHLDIRALEQQHIAWANAPGCNAQAVAEYVVTALLSLKPELIDSGSAFCLGIVGLGNVGLRLARLAQHFGWQILTYDPFVDCAEVSQVEFDRLLQQADAVSIHVPLTNTGLHPTYHLFNQTTFKKLSPHAILINSARGAVIEEQALLEDIAQTKRQVVLDVFEHEPKISSQLLEAVSLATPHIAGYSLEGKARGTAMIYQAFCKKFGFTAEKSFETQLAPCQQILAHKEIKSALKQHLNIIYDIRQDDAALRACVQEGYVLAQAFDRLRKNYPLRREWLAYGAQL